MRFMSKMQFMIQKSPFHKYKRTAMRKTKHFLLNYTWQFNLFKLHLEIYCVGICCNSRLVAKNCVVVKETGIDATQCCPTWIMCPEGNHYWAVASTLFVFTNSSQIDFKEDSKNYNIWYSLMNVRQIHISFN